MNFRYFRPTSLTWWAGMFSITIGALLLSGAGEWASELGRFIAIMAGGQDASPAALFVLGAGLVGIRDKIERIFEGEE